MPKGYPKQSTRMPMMAQQPMPMRGARKSTKRVATRMRRRGRRS